MRSRYVLEVEVDADRFGPLVNVSLREEGSAHVIRRLRESEVPDAAEELLKKYYRSGHHLDLSINNGTGRTNGLPSRLERLCADYRGS